MLHWRDASPRAKVIGDDERADMARRCIEDVRASGCPSWRETGDAFVIAFTSGRAPDEVEVVDAIVRRRGEERAARWPMSERVRLQETWERTVHITKDAMLGLIRQNGYDVPPVAVVRYVDGHVLVTWSELVVK